MNIKDLHIEEEIVPFFDFNLNSYSRKALSELFLNIPQTIAQVTERQDILQAMISNIRSFKNLYSYRTDIEEVVFFCNTISSYLFLSKSRQKLKFTLLFDGKQKTILLSKARQSLHIFKTIYQNYFENLTPDRFPNSYRIRVKSIISTLTGLLSENFLQNRNIDNENNNLLYDHLTLLFKKSTDNSLHNFWKEFFLFEAYLSIASTCKKNNFSMPEFITKGIEIHDFYHPILKTPVKNLISLSTNVVLLTGPNMSGKSTLLKAISLCVYLAHAGFAVPASHCRLPFFSDLNVFFNSHDDLDKGYSQFMLEVLNLKEVVISALKGKQVFGAFDEIFKGTNADDAAHILEVTLKGLKKFPDSIFFISTHLQLKERYFSDNNHISCYYVDSSYENNQITFNYTLKKGVSDVKLGFILFEKEGLNKLLGE